MFLTVDFLSPVCLVGLQRNKILYFSCIIEDVFFINQWFGVMIYRDRSKAVIGGWCVLLHSCYGRRISFELEWTITCDVSYCINQPLKLACRHHLICNDFLLQKCSNGVD